MSKLPKLKFLVVDDAKFIRDLVKKTLRTDYPDFIVVEAENGRKAQQAMQGTEFDMVLCDWEMPEMSGIELLQWVRGEEDFAMTPFIMVTSLDKREHVVEALNAGVNDYISKPFSAEQLITKVMRQLVKLGKLTEAQTTPASQNTGPFSAVGGAEILAGSFASAKAKTARAAATRIKKGLLLLEEQRLPTQILSLNKEEASLFISYEGVKPRLADELVLGLAFSVGDKTYKSTVKGFIKSLELKEANPASTRISLTMCFNPMDEATQKNFHQLLAVSS